MKERKKEEKGPDFAPQLRNIQYVQWNLDLTDDFAPKSGLSGQGSILLTYDREFTF